MGKMSQEERYRRKKENALSRREEIIDAITPEILRLSMELHGGQYAPNQSEFEIYAEGQMPNRTLLHHTFGKWSNVAAVCGLTLADPGYYYHKAKERQQEWEQLAKTPPSRTSRKPSERQQADAPMGLFVRETPRIDTWRSVKDGKTYQGLAWGVI